jgi:hypothetical protein
MFEKLLKKLQAMGRPPVVFDPARFNDPLALQAEWSPLRNGGTNFRTHKLIPLHADRLEFQAATGAKLFCVFFALVGALLPCVFLALLFLNEEFAVDMGPVIIVPLLMGLIFLSVGVGMYYYGAAPIVFDKFRGCFWKGRKAPNEVLDISALKNACRLEDIHALQLLSEYVRGNKSAYYSYEMNLVLNDGKRLNVVDHGNQAKLREDTQTLATFLNVPVWDAT